MCILLVNKWYSIIQYRYIILCGEHKNSDVLEGNGNTKCTVFSALWILYFVTKKILTNWCELQVKFSVLPTCTWRHWIVAFNIYCAITNNKQISTSFFLMFLIFTQWQNDMCVCVCVCDFWVWITLLITFYT